MKDVGSAFPEKILQNCPLSVVVMTMIRKTISSGKERES